MIMLNTNKEGYKEYKHEQTGMIFVLIPSATFKMGSEEYNTESEKPIHKVTLDNFLIAKYPVTQGVWKKIMGSNTSYFSNSDDCPVEGVSWEDCQKFCKITGLRLPTEAEWEYACRAGTKTKYYWGDDPDGKYMWYDLNSESKTHPVGKKEPNGFGLYDMLGNVWEWCQDWYDIFYYASSPDKNPAGPLKGEYRVSRGGSWKYGVVHCRSANRGYYLSKDAINDIGFRCALLP